MCRQLMQLARELQAGYANPFASLLEPYSHIVYRVGACQLFPADDCKARRFRSYELAMYFVSLFETAAIMSESQLSRYDLHHAHMYFDSSRGILGLLFHTREYPSFDEHEFPFNLGYCQQMSTLAIESEKDMGCRTVLLTFGGNCLVLLDGPDRAPFGTIYESEFGRAVADIYYFESRFGSKDEGLNRGLHVVPYV